MRFLLLSSALILLITMTGSAVAKETKMHAIYTPDTIKWQDAPNSLPKGAKVAVLEGDPAKEGPFTLRLEFPPNYRIPPHWHPVIEHITVMAGTFYMGLGDQFDKKIATTLPIGSFAYMMPKMHHFAFTGKKAAIVQLHGMGPWGITYINPSDDPRNQHS